MRRGMRGTVAATVTASLLGGVLLLGGCSVGRPSGRAVAEAAPTTPTLDPMPAPTPTPASVEGAEPQRPDAMGEADATGVVPVVHDDEAGAIAVAEYFLTLYKYVYDTGDLTGWRGLSHQECIFCASVVSDVEDRRAQAVRSEGGAFTVRSADARAVRPGFYTVTMMGDQEPSIDRSADGRVVETPGSSYRLTVIVLSEAGRWSIREVQVDEERAS